MAETFRPATPAQVAELVSWAAAEGVALDIAGAGTKSAFGRPVQAAARLEMAGLAGIVDYEPDELVITLKPGTPLAEVEAVLAAKGQQLAFEPPDLGPLLGGAPDGGTIGGAVACNLSGPRRVKAGAARDHVLGFKAVSGRGEAFKAGGRVVKNVTGFDLSKLMAGSFGTLAVLTELTLKVIPAPEKTRTVLVFGLDVAGATPILAAAMASPNEVSGAAHLPATAAGRSAIACVRDTGAAVTALRVEGPAPSVAYRREALTALVGAEAPVEELHGANSDAFWREVSDVRPFASADGRQVWRLSVPPAAGVVVVAAVLSEAEGEAFLDWGGGLVWMALAPRADAGHETVRAAVAAVGGHATLVRADAGVRSAVPVFQPQPAALAALGARVKAAFDPRAILNPGRMVAGV